MSKTIEAMKQAHELLGQLSIGAFVKTNLDDAIKREEALEAKKVQAVPIGEVKKLADWHSKTAKLWYTGEEQSTFHCQAATTLHAIIAATAAEQEPTPPPGYTAEELDKDNPHTQWTQED
jgi:hypothetical protein